MLSNVTTERCSDLNYFGDYNKTLTVDKTQPGNHCNEILVRVLKYLSFKEVFLESID